jgi:hypothetical protein
VLRPRWFVFRLQGGHPPTAFGAPCAEVSAMSPFTEICQSAFPVSTHCGRPIDGCSALRAASMRNGSVVIATGLRPVLTIYPTVEMALSQAERFSRRLTVVRR